MSVNLIDIRRQPRSDLLARRCNGTKRMCAQECHQLLKLSGKASRILKRSVRSISISNSLGSYELALFILSSDLSAILIDQNFPGSERMCRRNRSGPSVPSIEICIPNGKYRPIGWLSDHSLWTRGRAWNKGRNWFD